MVEQTQRTLAQANGRVASAQMTGAFWKQHAKTNAMLPDQVRDAIVDSGASVLVHAIRDGQSKHGPTWFIDIEFAGATFTLPQSHNQMRDPMLLGLADFIRMNGAVACGIESFPTPKGTGFDLCPPQVDYDPSVTLGWESAIPGAISSGTSSNDEVPF